MIAYYLVSKIQGRQRRHFNIGLDDKNIEEYRPEEDFITLKQLRRLGVPRRLNAMVKLAIHTKCN